MKDNFSTQSNQYAKFRPTYPQGLYNFLLSLVTTKETAWDCGTGNGQVAQELSKYFTTVYATDISEKQIANAVQKDNIIYKVEGAEKTEFPSNTFDLITIAQAIHWFNFNVFYEEAKRVMKPDAIIAVIGYGLIRIDDATDKIIDKFYYETIGSYWDKERKYVDENYTTIPFPFKEINAPVLYNTFEWNVDQMIGYLQTWSAIQHYIKANNSDPVELIQNELRNVWNNETKKVCFPILLRVGKQ